jgi:hypothetical protein
MTGVGLSPGEIAHLRHFQHDEVSGFFTMRVVRHDADGLLLYGVAGTRFWRQDMPDGRTLSETSLPEWVGSPKAPVPFLSKHSQLSWHPTGADYSIRVVFFRGRFTNWYANLEEPAVAWRDEGLAGLDTVDWDLDVWVDPDRSWRWKDEELFAERLRFPSLYWVSDEARVRRAGRDVIALVEAAAFPFDGSLCDYRPDESWTPIIADAPPPGWDRPRARAG